jgi:single-strand DNA-binding protein
LQPVPGALDKIKTRAKLYVEFVLNGRSFTKEKTMPALNRVELIGRLGKDPETRFTPTGKQVTQFRIAISRQWRDAEGESQERTEWVNIEAWGRLGEICQQYLSKGRLVYVDGRLQTDVYGEGDERKYFTKVVARQMQMLDRKPEEGEPEAPPIEEEEFPFE